jgi:hypothetical protein
VEQSECKAKKQMKEETNSRAVAQEQEAGTLKNRQQRAAGAAAGKRCILAEGKQS